MFLWNENLIIVLRFMLNLFKWLKRISDYSVALLRCKDEMYFWITQLKYLIISLKISQIHRFFAVDFLSAIVQELWVWLTHWLGAMWKILTRCTGIYWFLKKNHKKSVQKMNFGRFYYLLKVFYLEHQLKKSQFSARFMWFIVVHSVLLFVFTCLLWCKYSTYFS